jgi:hypothetical protein
MLVLVASLPMVHPVGTAAANPAGRYVIDGTARQEESGYRHVIVVKNKSRDSMQCHVWTDVDPQPPITESVGPKSTLEIAIRANAENAAFSAFGFCQVVD